MDTHTDHSATAHEVEQRMSALATYVQSAEAGKGLNDVDQGELADNVLNAYLEADTEKKQKIKSAVETLLALSKPLRDASEAPPTQDVVPEKSTTLGNIRTLYESLNVVSKRM